MVSSCSVDVAGLLIGLDHPNWMVTSGLHGSLTSGLTDNVMHCTAVLILSVKGALQIVSDDDDDHDHG